MTGKIPKSSQLYFYLMPLEASEVLKFINDQNGLILLRRSSSKKPVIYNLESDSDTSQYVITSKENLSRVITYKISESCYSIDYTVSPVIELDCCILGEDVLSRGRIYFRAGFDGREGWESYHPSIYSMYKSISSFMRKVILTKERFNGAFISKKSIIYRSSGGVLGQF